MGAGGFTYGHRIRALRKEAGLTQGQLGQRLDISTQVMSMYENGREPPYEILCNIAGIFGVSTDYLLGLTNYRNPEAQKKAEDDAKERGSSVALFLQNLRPDIRERLLPSLEKFLQYEDDTESFAIISNHLSEIIDHLREIRSEYTRSVYGYKNSDSSDRDELFSCRLDAKLANNCLQMVADSALLRKELLAFFVERDMKAVKLQQELMTYGDTIPRPAAPEDSETEE